MNTEERLAKLEQRVEALERLVEDGRAKLAAWSETPTARKLARMFGVTLP